MGLGPLGGNWDGGQTQCSGLGALMVYTGVELGWGAKPSGPNWDVTGIGGQAPWYKLG